MAQDAIQEFRIGARGGFGSNAEDDLELIEFLEADLLPDGAQSVFKEQLRCQLRELLRERDVLQRVNVDSKYGAARRGGDSS